MKPVTSKSKAIVGDIFAIPLTETTYAVGQVAEDLGDLLYVVIFSKEHQGDRCMPRLEDERIALASITTDAKLWHGHWRVIGNTTANLSRVARPFFRVHYFSSDKYYVESLTGDVSAPASPDDVELYRNRFTVSPKGLESASLAYFGYQEWEQRFDKLKYEDVEKRSKFITA